MATASLGRLTLDLVAKIGNFTEPMTKAERHAKSSSNNIADSFGIASVAAKALGVAVAVHLPIRLLMLVMKLRSSRNLPIALHAIFSIMLKVLKRQDLAWRNSLISIKMFWIA